MKKKILIITYHFPPDSDVGGLRVQKYAKYLPLYGWNPLVLTVKETHYPVKDYARMADVTCEVHRTGLLPGLRDLYLMTKEAAGRFLRPLKGRGRAPSGETAPPPANVMGTGLRKLILSLMWLPDDRTGWIVPAVLRAVQIARSHRLDAIMTTSPPHSVQVTGLILKFILRRRWIIDFRDAWSLAVSESVFSGAEEWLERMAVKHADQVITATDSVRSYLTGKYPDLPPGKFVCIPNGFDREDFKLVRPRTDQFFTISYIGDFYYGRSPETYLRALSELIREERLDRKKIRLRFIGKVRQIGARPLQDMLSEFGLQKSASVEDVIPYTQSIQRMLSSDILMVVSPQTFMQPTKAFEYMACGAYILAFTPPGALADLIKGYPKGCVIGLNDVAHAKEAIMKCYERSLRPGAPSPAEHEAPGVDLSDYERKNLTGKLARCLEIQG